MSIIFLNGIANRRHHSQVRNRPRTMFFYGLESHQKANGHTTRYANPIR